MKIKFVGQWNSMFREPLQPHRIPSKDNDWDNMFDVISEVVHGELNFKWIHGKNKSKTDNHINLVDDLKTYFSIYIPHRGKLIIHYD